MLQKFGSYNSKYFLLFTDSKAIHFNLSLCVVEFKKSACFLYLTFGLEVTTSITFVTYQSLRLLLMYFSFYE